MKPKIHSLPCSTCEPASQRESASGLSTASAVMPVVRFTCCKQLCWPMYVAAQTNIHMQYSYTVHDYHAIVSGHEPCCVTIYQNSLLVAFCKIYPLQISYLGLEALDKNAWCPCSQTNVFCRIGRLYLQINPHVGTFGSQACLYQDERDWRPRRSFQRVPNRCHRTDAAIWTNLHRDTCEFDPRLSFENCFK